MAFNPYMSPLPPPLDAQPDLPTQVACEAEPEPEAAAGVHDHAKPQAASSDRTRPGPASTVLAQPARAGRAVPQGRAQRLFHLGRAVGEMAVSAAASGLQQWARGERPSLPDLMLTPGNARRLTERLSTLRGAAMKLGQLMSLDGHGVLPPEFAELLSGLRDQAQPMPATQLAAVLQAEYGAQWHERFRRLSFEPVAAASIGQVHRAETHDGQVLALKIQYPGVRRSIASDVANIGLLLRTPGLVPGHLDLAPLLAQLREQLLLETDYAREAAQTTAYRAALGADPVLWVPAVVPEHCTPHILATAFAPGRPLTHWVGTATPQAEREHIAQALCRLSVREFFDMRLVQTDPNIGNYLFDAATGRIALLDFGATETVTSQRVAELREIGLALKAADRTRLEAAAHRAGFIGADDAPAQTQAVIDLMLLSGEPLRHVGRYDFAASRLVKDVFERGRQQVVGGAGFARTPPPDLLFLQRKFAGSFMLCAKLQARVDVAAVFGAHLQEPADTLQP